MEHTLHRKSRRPRRSWEQTIEKSYFFPPAASILLWLATKGGRAQLSGNDVLAACRLAAEKKVVTCHRSFIQQQLESRGYVRHAARVEQRAIGGAGRGCAADRPLR